MNTELLGLFAFICGIVMPFVISVIKRPGMGSAWSVMITLAVSLVVGGVSAVLDGSIKPLDLDFENPEVLLGTATTAFTAATVSYKTWFQGSQLNTNLTYYPAPAPITQMPVIPAEAGVQTSAGVPVIPLEPPV